MTDRRPPEPAAPVSGRADLLDLLRAEGAATVPELAVRTGLHGNTVRTHLQHLAGQGHVISEPEDRSVRGRPRLVYRAVTARPGDPVVPRADEGAARAALTRMLLAGYGADLPEVSAAAQAAGERLLVDLPGHAPVVGTGRAAQQTALLDHLDRLGFDPEPSADGRTVDLRRCPFLDLARARPEVVCAVHLGLARRLLAGTDGPLRADRLVPFTGPRRCTLHLTDAHLTDPHLTDAA
jgi:predicted ArsR family transcriptional regulator